MCTKLPIPSATTSSTSVFEKSRVDVCAPGQIKLVHGRNIAGTRRTGLSPVNNFTYALGRKGSSKAYSSYARTIEENFERPVSLYRL